MKHIQPNPEEVKEYFKHIPGRPSPWRLIIESLFMVQSKSGVLVPFKLNKAQATLDMNMTGRDLVPKARQLGISAYVLGRFSAQCITLPNWRAVIISHEEEATKRLLYRVRQMLENPRSDLGEWEMEETELVTEFERLSQAEIRFKETGAWFYIGTAGAKAFGRGDTINALHFSEFAFWENPERLAVGLFNSVPLITLGGEIIIESTGNTDVDAFAMMVQSARAGKSTWSVSFFPWSFDEEYKLPKEMLDTLTFATPEELEEPRLIKDFKLTPEQLAWRRFKIGEATGFSIGDKLKRFSRDNPLTVDECFQGRGGQVFETVTYRPTLDWDRKIGAGYEYGKLPSHPVTGYHYIIGADPAGGTGGNASVAHVGCVETNEQVAKLSTNRIPPHVFAEELSKLGREYNEALLCVENNNHGHTVMYALSVLNYPAFRIYKQASVGAKPGLAQARKEAGITTSAQKKPLLIGKAVQLCMDGYILHDERTYMEVMGFVETEEGKLEGGSGMADDEVLALAMLAEGWTRAALQATPEAMGQGVKAKYGSVEWFMEQVKEQKRGQGEEYGVKSYLACEEVG